MQDQEIIKNEVEEMASKIEDRLTDGLVRHSSCFPSESSYCSGVEDAIRSLIDELFQNYNVTKK